MTQPADRRLLTEASGDATYVPQSELPTLATKTDLDPLVPLAGIMPTIQQTRVGSAAARNVGLGDRLPRHVKLIQADTAAETPTNYSGMTITHHADSPWGQGIPAWSGVGDGGSVRFNMTLAAPPDFTGTVPSVIGAEVWLERADPTAAIQVLLRGGAGVWSRYSNQSGSSHETTGGIPLRPGSNIVRIGVGASTPANVPGSTSNEVRFDVPAGTRVWVRRTWVETPLKPRVAFIVDWGAKSGYEAWKQDLHPLGVPMTAALRVGRLGTGTPPNDHMTVADVKELISLGGSASIHSFEGAAMSGMTPEQVRADLTAAISELQRQGIYTDGAIHRAAWTQNLAPNALAVKDMMVTARTYGDSTPATSWPPTSPLSMPARRIGDSASIDAKFAEIKATNSMWLGFIHGVTPTGDANHISQANWDYFVSKVAAEVSAGTTEFVTIEDLARRERLFHLPHLGLV